MSIVKDALQELFDEVIQYVPPSNLGDLDDVFKRWEKNNIIEFRNSAIIDGMIAKDKEYLKHVHRSMANSFTEELYKDCSEQKEITDSYTRDIYGNKSVNLEVSMYAFRNKEKK